MSSTTTDGDSKLPLNDDQKTTGKATKRRPRRGVRTLERTGKASPFGVEWRVAGARKTEWFAEAADRDRRAAALEKERRANTLAIVPVRSELQEWREFKDAIGDTPWRNVVDAWKRGGGSPRSLKVSEAVERFLRSQDERLAEGKIAKVSHRKIVPRRKRLARTWATWNCP